MNEEEKKEQLFDLGNGRFVDVNKLILVAQQEGNQNLYTSSWSRKGRRDKIQTAINDTLQAIKDGHITGRNANKSFNFSKDVLQQTGKRYDPNSHALDYLNWLFDHENAPEDFFTQPKPKEEPKKEEPKKFTGSTVSNYFTRIGLFNPDGTLDRATYEVNDIDPKTKKLISEKNRLLEAINHFIDLDKQITTIGTDGSRSSTWDFSDESSPFANYEDYNKAFTAIKGAQNFALLRQALSRYGIQNEDDWVRTETSEPPVVTKPKTSAERHAEFMASQAADAASIQAEVARAQYEAGKTWPEYLASLLVKPDGWDTRKSYNTTGGVPEGYDSETDYNDIISDFGKALQKLEVFAPYYANLVNSDEYKLYVTTDKSGRLHIEGFAPNAPYYLAYDPKTKSVSIEWKADDSGMISQIHDLYMDNVEQTTLDNIRDKTHVWYYPAEKNGGILNKMKWLRNGGVVKASNGFVFPTGAKNDSIVAAINKLVELNERSKKLLEAKLQAEAVAKAAEEAKAENQYNRNLAKLENQGTVTGFDWSDPYVIGTLLDAVGAVLSMRNDIKWDLAGSGFGVAGTVFNAVGDYNDDSVGPWGDTWNLTKNLGFDLLGFVPRWATTKKMKSKSKASAAKALNIISQALNTGAVVQAGINSPEIYKSFEKLVTSSENLTKDDLRNMSLFMQLLLGTAKSVRGRSKQKIEQTKTGEVTVVKGKKGQTLVTPEQLAQLRGAKDYKEANKIFLEISDGDNLPFEREGWLFSKNWDVKNPVITSKKVSLSDSDVTWPYYNWWNGGTSTTTTTPKMRIHSLNGVIVEKKGGKLNQVKALRKGGILKFEPGGLFEGYKKWYTSNYGYGNVGDLDVNTFRNTDAYKLWINSPEGKEYLENLNKSTTPYLSNWTDGELKYFNYAGIKPDLYGSASEFRNSEEYLNYLNSNFNTNQELKEQASKAIAQTVNPSNLGSSGTGSAGTWRHVGGVKYFDGTNYTEQALTDGVDMLNNMDASKRLSGIDALKKATTTEEWNLIFNTYFGDINNAIVGYNLNKDLYDGVSTQLRQNIIKGFADLVISNYDPLKQTKKTNSTDVLTLDEDVPIIDETLEEEEPLPLLKIEKSGTGKRPETPEEDKYKKVSNLWDWGKYVNSRNTIDRINDLTVQNIRDNIYQPLNQFVPLHKLLSGFGQALEYQRQQDLNYNMMAANQTSDASLNKMAMLATMSQNNNLALQGNAIINKYTDLSADLVFNDLKLQLQLYYQTALERIKNTLAANSAIGNANIAAELARGQLDNDFMTLQKLTELQNVKDWNAALYANKVDKATLDYQNAVNYANLHLADDANAWLEYVNKAANTLASLQSDERTKMYGFKTGLQGPNFTVAKKGGKLDRDAKIQIENSRFLSKQLVQLLKNQDKGLDRLSKITYKAILKSLGLE